MAKQLNVNLNFDADTQKAKAQINDLMKTLQKVATQAGAAPSIADAQTYKDASVAAKELQQHLKAATDVNTGKLNLSALSASLKASGKDLDHYRTNLEKIGPSGETAFLKVSKSIALADAPLRKTNKRLAEFATTLKNTARWQISSSLLHGFMGTLQSAYGYAQDLNKSLNDIRIVTGQSVEQMGEFADKANKAAKALSTTTKTYTDAALIFYQQGLNESGVKERTDAVVKMSTVTGESATEVSSYMTAIWNNFADGSQELEHYADVITALGAATASSSAEIAGGLEKFAAIGNQIGLSYDYATSALATVVAETRQSEDVVGTAFKTIFARIQGLNLGETLEDGTDLNKYSKALDVIGISIKDVNGDVKDMDTILNELGNKWGSLTKDVQIATAQTVAGVRQYNQLIALMDNWDKFQNNVTIAKTSDGELQKQADIYAESWEASEKRVKAALENIYNTLLDDKFFISLNNGFATLLDGVKGFIDGFGGMKGIIFTLSGFISQKLAKEAPAALNTIKQNLMQITGYSQQMADDTQKKNISWLQAKSKDAMQTFEEGEGSLAYAADVQLTEMIAEQKNKLIQYENEYSQAEKAAAESEIQHLQTIQELLTQEGKRYDELSAKSSDLEAKIEELGQDFSITFKGESGQGMAELTTKLRDVVKTASGLKVAKKEFSNLDKTIEDNKDNIKGLAKNYSNLAKSMMKTTSGQAKTEWNNLSQALKSAANNADLTAEQFKEIIVNSAAFKNIGTNLQGAEQEIKDLTNAMYQCEEVPNSNIKEFIAVLREMGIISMGVPMSLDNARDSMIEIKQHAASGSEAIMSFSGALMQANAFISSMSSLGDVFTDEDATTIQKIGAAVGAMTSAIMVMNSISQLTRTLMALETKEKEKNAIATFLSAVAKGSEATADSIALPGKWANVAATIAQTLANWGLNASMAPLLVVTLALVAAVAILVIGITAVVAAFKAWQASTPEGKLKAAKEEAKAMQEQFEEAKQAVEDLKSSFDTYDSVIDKLNECTKGTEEWKDALRDVNNQVLDMMQDYPELASMVNEAGDRAITRNEDGQLEIAEWARDALENGVDQRLKTTQAASIQTNRKVREAQIDLQKSKAPTLDNGAAQEVFDQVYAQYGAAMTAEDYKKALKENEYGKNWSDGLVDTWTEKAMDLVGSMGGLYDAIQANTTATEAENDVLASILLDDNSKVQNSDYENEIVDVTGDAYEEAYNKAYDALDRWGKDGISKATGVNNEAEKVFNEYLKAAGLENEGYTLTDTTGTDGVRKFVYEDAAGEEHEISLKTMRAAKAAADANEQLGQNAEKLVEVFTRLGESSNAADQALLDLASHKNLNETTGAELADLEDEINSTEINGVTGINAYLDKKFGNGKDGKISDETAQMYGYETAEAMAQAYLDAIETAKNNLDPSKLAESMGIEANGKVYNTVGDSFSALFNEIDYSEMTAGAMKDFSKAYQQIFEQGGKEALDIVDSIVKDAGDNADEVAALMANTDWTNWDSIEALKVSCADLGYEVDDNLIRELQKANGAVKEFDASKFCEQLATIMDIINGTNTGDTISAEEYAALGEGFENYFMAMADGTYKLIGDAEAFKAAVMGVTTDDLLDKMDEAKVTREAMIEKQKAAEEAMGGYSLDTLQKDQFNKYEDGPKDGYAGWYSGDTVNAQIDFLEQMGYNADQIQAWRDDLENNDTTTDVLTKISEEVQAVTDEYEGYSTAIAEADAQLQKAQEAYASTATHFSELDQMLEDGIISAEAYSKAWTAMDNEKDMSGLDPEEVEAYADSLQDVYKEQGLTEQASKKMAQAIMRMNRGVKELGENFDDYKDILNNSSETSQEYSEAMNSVKNAVADLTNVSTDYISNDFIKQHMEDIEKAATGDAEAIDRLGQELSKSIIASIVVENGLDEEGTQAIWDSWNSLQTNLSDISVGVSLDGENEFVTALNEMIEKSGMTATQVNELLSSMGFETNFATETQPQTQTYPVTRTMTEVSGYTSGTTIGPNGEEIPWQYPILDTQTQEVDKVLAEGEVTAFAMSTDGSTPKIDSITRVSSGASNNYSSSNGGGTKSNGSKPKEAKKPDKKKAEEPEIDKYRTITEQLEKLNKELDNIGKAKDRAFGPAKLKLMQQEIDKQDEIIKKNKEYLKMLEQDRNEKRSKLESLGAEFDEKGTITNYEELIKKNQPDYTKYNEGIEYYRGLTGQQQEDLDKEYQGKTDADGNYYSSYEDYLNKTYGETAEKSHEEFMNLLDEYAKVDSEYSDKVQENIEREWAKFDIKLAGIEYVVDVKLDVDDRDLRYLEFLLEELEDKDFSAAESIANIGAQVDTSLGKIDTYRQGINDILGEVGEGYTVDDLMSGNVSLEQLQQEGLSADGLAKLEEYIDGLGEENSKLRELRENAWAQVSEEFNEYIDKMDDGIEKIEHLKNITQSYKNIVDIVGKNFLGISNDLMDKMNAATVKQSKDAVEANKAKMEAIQASYDELLNQDTSGWSDQAKKKREEQLKEMEAELQGAKEAFMSSWEEALQASADRYAAAVDNIISEFEDKIAGLYGTLDELQEAYDRASDLDSQYLEDYEQIYQLSKLTRDINNSIDDTDNIAAKEQYKELLEEINEIEANGTKMSEYDLQVLQKKFELKQAQMALEEAQNAKSSVSMVRGEDGNFSYVYTASDEDVANAEQNYEDKLHEMQQLNGDYINDLQSKIIQTQAECADALAQIKESDYNSYEEWREAVDRTQAYYDEKMNFYYSQLDGALANNRDLYENDWQNYSDLTGYKISADENYVDKFGETNYAILTGFQSTEEAHSAWNTASQEMLLELSDAYATWQCEVEGIMGAAGTSVEGFANTMETETDRSVVDSEKVKESVQETAQSMEEDFANTVAAIVNWEQTWGEKAQAAIDKNKELIESYNELKRAMADALGSEDGGSGGGGDSGNGGSGSGGSSGGSGSGQNATDNSDKAAGVAAAIWMDGGATSGWYNGGDRRTRLNEKGVAAAQSYINAHGPNGDIYSQWHNKRDQLKNFYYGSFATGGYTGDWGDSSGRLAVLHSKEIVLNKDDTQNFLKAIDMVREMSHIIDLNAKYASAQYEAMMQPMVGRGGSPEIVQNIEINAEFPDATDHSEIEMAFNNLINTASQYANRVR